MCVRKARRGWRTVYTRLAFPQKKMHGLPQTGRQPVRCNLFISKSLEGLHWQTLFLSVFAFADGRLSLIFIRFLCCNFDSHCLASCSDFSYWPMWVNQLQCVVGSHRIVECIWNMEKEVIMAKTTSDPHVIYFSCSIKQEIIRRSFKVQSPPLILSIF